MPFPIFSSWHIIWFDEVLFWFIEVPKIVLRHLTRTAFLCQWLHLTIFSTFSLLLEWSWFIPKVDWFYRNAESIMKLDNLFPQLLSWEMQAILRFADTPAVFIVKVAFIWPLREVQGSLHCTSIFGWCKFQSDFYNYSFLPQGMHFYADTMPINFVTSTNSRYWSWFFKVSLWSLNLCWKYWHYEF